MEMVPPSTKPTFEESFPEIRRIVWSRKGGWSHLSLMEWSDVAAIVTARIWEKWDLYDPAKPLENWCNTLISNSFKNLKRDLGGRWHRPCVGGGKANGSSCAHNLGGDTCEVTKSRTQCAECPLYAEWEKTRRHQFNIKVPVALENHTREVGDMPGESFDIKAVEATVHQQMKVNLTQWEWRIYHALYVRHLKPAAVSEELQELPKTWKRALRAEEQTSYAFVLDRQRWFKELMFDILKREGYDLKETLNYAR